jgi:hypothetical protein
MAQASGTFSPQRNSIIARALRQCIAIESGETPGAQEISDANDALNALIAGWQATGLHVWKETEGILFLQPNQIKYSIGGTNTDQSCFDANWVGTTTSGVINQGSTIVPLTSVAGISSGDNIGITLSTTNGLFWTTVDGAPSGSTVTLAAPLPAAVNSSANVVDYAPAYKLPRPLRIPDARRYYLSSQIDTPLITMSRLDYRDLPNKTTPGTVTGHFYDPQLNIGIENVWPAPPDSLSAVRFTFYQQIYDFQTAADTPDFPQEWVNALTWGLADEIAPEYGVGQVRMAKIQEKAAYWLDVVQGWDREPESFYLGVNFDQSSR